MMVSSSHQEGSRDVFYYRQEGKREVDAEWGCGRWLWARVGVLSGADLMLVCLVHGGSRSRDWPFWRCGEIRRHGLGLEEAKGASVSSWDG
jgi:hypothetical protein